MAHSTTKNNVAAFFDFDGIWYDPMQPWQINNIRIGVLGTCIAWEDAYEYWQQAKKKTIPKFT